MIPQSNLQWPAGCEEVIFSNCSAIKYTIAVMCCQNSKPIAVIHPLNVQVKTNTNTSMRCDNMMVITGGTGLRSVGVLRRFTRQHVSFTKRLAGPQGAGMILWGSRQSVYVIQQSYTKTQLSRRKAQRLYYDRL